MQLIDVGVNLTNHRLFDRLASVIDDAQNNHVIHQIITGTSIESSEHAIEISKTKPGYFSSTAGCHPHDAKDFIDNHRLRLIELSKQDSVVAIGECGLDFNRNFSPQDIQIKVFEQQIEISSEVNLPLFMHQRDAHDSFIELLTAYKDKYSSGVVHCFTGDKKQLKDCLDLGLYIGITGWICDHRRNADLKDALQYLPLDRLMVETDSPYLLPRNIKPKPKSNTNFPAHLPWIVEQIAEILNVPPENIAQQTIKNTSDFFSLTI